MTCKNDYCDLDTLSENERESIRNMVKGLHGAAREKLLHWMGYMEPMDYDAPGSTAREQGV